MLHNILIVFLLCACTLNTILLSKTEMKEMICNSNPARTIQNQAKVDTYPSYACFISPLHSTAASELDVSHRSPACSSRSMSTRRTQRLDQRLSSLLRNPIIKGIEWIWIDITEALQLSALPGAKKEQMFLPALQSWIIYNYCSMIMI